MSHERFGAHCQVCGASEVQTDAVIDCGVVLLAHCSRCDHRWTGRGELAEGRLRSSEPTRRMVSAAASEGARELPSAA